MTTVSRLLDGTARDLAAAIAHGSVSATEVAAAANARAAARDAELGMFITRTPDLALERAAAIDRAVAARGPAILDELPLVGVPCPIKDLSPVAGVRYTGGSIVWSDRIADRDDGVVTLLRTAGTVMTGKTNTPELGLPCYTEPDVAPPARTPWDLGRTAGGSSGGAAAAVAAGIAPIAHGSDGGGSIRIPAACCGIVGLKPSRGRISPGPDGVDVSGLVSHGVLARDVRDAAVMLDVLSAPQPGDATLPAPAGGFLAACDAEPRALRIGLLTRPVIIDTDVDPRCIAAVERTAAALERAGHTVVPVDRPYEPADWAAFADLWAVLAASAPVPGGREGELRPLTRSLREAGRAVSGVAFASALARATLLARRAARAWAGVDLVLSPTLAQVPAPIGGLRDDADPAADFIAQTRFTPWTSTYNLLGWPAISLPLWTTDDAAGDRTIRPQARALAPRTPDGRLPLGVMLAAPSGHEARLLRTAATLEGGVG